MHRIARTIESPRECPEGVSLITKDTRPVIELHMVRLDVFMWLDSRNSRTAFWLWTDSMVLSVHGKETLVK